MSILYRIMRLIAIILFCFCVSISAKLRYPLLLVTPSADILPSKQIGLTVNTNIFQYYDPTSESYSAWYKPSVEINSGLFNRIQLSAGYATAPTIQLKVQIFNDGAILKQMPALAVGGKDILGSKEGHLFGVTDSDTAASLANSFFLAASKNIPLISSRIHMGAMGNMSIESELVNPFWALETYIGGTATISYEGFRRFGSFHHLVTFGFRFGDNIKFGFGLTEVSKMFRQNSQTGFFLTGDSTTSGYGTPGIHVSISYHRFLTASSYEIPGLEDEVARLRHSVSELGQKKQTIESKIATGEKQLKEMNATIDERNKIIGQSGKLDHKILLDEEFMALSRITANESLPDPEIVAARMKKIVSMKELALPKITDIVRNPKSTPALITICIQMMGQIGDKQSKHQLIRLLDYKESYIKIESIIALGKLRDKSVISEIEKTIADTDPAVVMAANEVVARLRGEATDSVTTP